MTAMVLLGMLLAAGVLLLVRALRPSQPSLGEQLARLGAQTSYDERYRAAASTARSHTSKAHRWLARRLAGTPVMNSTIDDKLSRDLSLLNIDAAAFTATRVAVVAAGFLLAPVLCFIALAVTGGSTPAVVVLTVTLLVTLVAYVVPARRVHSTAESRRADFRAAITSYMDLVAMRAASGAGASEALADAARIGRGWPFARVRLALADARISGYTPARALGRLGEEIGMHELQDLSAQLLLADATGAQAEVTLRERARSLRDAQLAVAQGKAGERSQTMVIAQLLLALGFMLFVLYPPVSNFMTAL